MLKLYTAENSISTHFFPSRFVEGRTAEPLRARGSYMLRAIMPPCGSTGISAGRLARSLTDGVKRANEIADRAAETGLPSGIFHD
jgi:hypothetical protein